MTAWHRTSDDKTSLTPVLCVKTPDKPFFQPSRPVEVLTANRFISVYIYCLSLLVFTGALADLSQRWETCAVSHTTKLQTLPPSWCVNNFLADSQLNLMWLQSHQNLLSLNNARRLI